VAVSETVEGEPGPDRVGPHGRVVVFLVAVEGGIEDAGTPAGASEEAAVGVGKKGLLKGSVTSEIAC
jgi:hypothetical protein